MCAGPHLDSEGTTTTCSGRRRPRSATRGHPRTDRTTRSEADVNETATLSEYVSNVRIEDLPRSVVDFTKLLILDNLGCQIAGVEMPWSHRILDAVVPLSAAGHSTVVGRSGRLAPDTAAFLNGTFSHSNESDDSNFWSPSHPGAVSIPPAIAMGEHVGASGQTLIEAVVAAYESHLRIAYAVRPFMFARGHHPPLAVGPFASAAAAARIMELSPAETLNAISIAGSYSGGQMEYTQTGGSVKRLHCGIPASAGIRATLLAQAGVTGPPTMLEGKRGFLTAFAGEYDVSWLCRELGEKYLVKQTAIKLFSCCHLIQPVLEGIAILQKEQRFDPVDVECVRVFSTNPAAVSHVGTIKAPTDVLGAQFSLAFSVAMNLHGRPNSWWDYNEVDLADPTLVELANRVSTELVDGEEMPFVTMKHLRIEFRDGTVRELPVGHPIGEPDVLVSNAEVTDKFRRLTGPVVGADRAETIIATVDSLETLANVRQLGALLA
ncbi:MAG: hypothetical protein GEV10_18765 [Streptosporangiales bacterium]|nr:hypothetical protein [Streptosporangiales bacterium]